MLSKLIILLLSINCFANSLTFKKNNKVVKVIQLSELKKGTLKINNRAINSFEEKLYNAWRSYSKTYRGYDLYELLDSIYAKDWKQAKTISFSATDGYQQIANIGKMLKASKSKKAILSYTESGIKGFSHFSRKDKIINPGPLYLVWSNFKDSDKASHGDTLKWPYQLKAININY